MIEETETITVTKTTVADISDCVGLLEWAMQDRQAGIAVAVLVGLEGDFSIQVEGRTIDTVRLKLGDTLRWDGKRFEVESPPAVEEPAASDGSGNAAAE